jgi:hypothetical protein
MISLNVDKKTLPPGLVEQSLDTQYDFMAQSICPLLLIDVA